MKPINSFNIRMLTLNDLEYWLKQWINAKKRGKPLTVMYCVSFSRLCSKLNTWGGVNCVNSPVNENEN